MAAIDMVALKAKLAALKAATTKPIQEINNETDISRESNTSNDVVKSVVVVSTVPANVPALTSTDVIGTAKTSEIDYLDFLAKMNSLQQAIHTQHPTMPVLLMQIHKQLRADPELTSTLSEEGIGVIVRGLQIQTKTELVSVMVKETKSKKKAPVSLDMF